MAETQTYEPRLKTRLSRSRIRAGDEGDSSATPTRCRSRGSTRSSSTWASAKPSATPRRLHVGDEGPGRDHRPEAGRRPRPAQSIAGFKLREGMVIGAKVTLRKDRMYEFLDRLITIALPRVKDFRGLKPHQLRRPRQLRHGPARNTSCSRRSTTTRSTRSGAWTSSSAPPRETDDEARALLKEFQFPFNA